MPGQTGRLACAIWTNGGTSWGIAVLDSQEARRQHFDRSVGLILVEVDGIDRQFDITKVGFWQGGHVIQKSVRTFKDAHNLKPGDRVWLRIVEPHRVFRLEAE
jgi:hypothetical protein